MKFSRSVLLVATLASAPALADDGSADSAALRAEATTFLTTWNSLYRSVYTVSAEAAWLASTDVTPEHEGRRIGADHAYAAFMGDPNVIRTAKRLLEHEDALEPLQIRQLEQILLNAAQSPGTIPDVVAARVAAETRQSAILDGYEFCIGQPAGEGACPEPVTANDIVDALATETDLDRRLVVWNASKEIGKPLKPGLAELVKLRNQVAQELGYHDYFDLMVASYGMSTDEMMGLLDGMVTDMKPLYDELNVWTTRELAAKYGASLPTGKTPAHWYPNRWAQEWGGLVDATNLDPYFEGKSPEWIIQQAENFYVSLGYPKLPQSFWENSDLYPVPEGEHRHKNSHASAWHMDLENDLRSLMSVQPDTEWFYTSHHELGHIYYYVSYARPEVPYVLREGANRGFHEGVGELISLAASQPPYLKQVGILPRRAKISANDALLTDALERTVVFIPWSAGVMSRFEYELYSKNLPPEQWQRRWWGLVEQYQGIAPPDAARLDDPDLCDACTKTHINDDPAGYYDYAVATVVKHQLHEHICEDILRQDVHSCNYFGNQQVGDFLRSILEKGATEDWREVIEQATGEPMSTRAMVAYYEPLRKWLVKENAKAAKKAGR